MRSVKGCIHWLSEIARPARASIILESILGIFRAGVAISLVWVSKHLVDIATGQADGSMTLWVVCLVAGPLIQLAIGSSTMLIENRNEVRLRNSLKSYFFNRVLNARMDSHGDMHSGDLSSRITDDVSAVSGMLCRDIPYTVITMAQLAGALAYLMYLDIRLGFLLVLVMPLFLLVSRYYVRRLHPVNMALREADSRSQEYLQEHLRHRHIIKAMQRIGYVTDGFNAISDTVHSLTIKRTRKSLTAGLPVQVGFALGYALVFAWSVYGLKSGAVSFGVMTAFLQLVALVQRPTIELSRQIPAFVKTMASIERLLDILGMDIEPQAQPIHLQSPVGVRICDVDFTYPGVDRPVIGGFTHTFEPNSLSAILGPTGAGKTTIFRLILGLIDPQHGSIELFDSSTGVKASNATRCNIAYVPQGNTLLSGTVRSNLLLGNPEATAEDMNRALTAACASFVYDLPQGIDTPCGESGYGFSEGQAQRISIARALLSRRGLILLDEPTSALDADTGRRLLKNLQAYTASSTIIIITHSDMVAQCCRNIVKISKI